MQQKLFLPSLAHWTYGNHWSGSGGRVRFYVTTSPDDLFAEVWDQDVCHELAQIRESAHFPVTEDGIEEMRLWLTAQMDAFS